MSQVLSATFDNGVFTPDGKVDLAPGTKVQLMIAPAEPTLEQRQQAFADWQRYVKEHPIDTRGERLTREQIYDRR